MQILFGAFLLLQYIFVIQFLLTINGNPLWSIPPPQNIFLIQFSCKFDANPPFHPNTYSLFNSYPKLMEILSAASLLSQIHIPYATLIKK
jgi:hypothetical protein